MLSQFKFFNGTGIFVFGYRTNFFVFQFLCIPQPVYCELVQLGQENIELLTDESGCVVTVKEKRDYDNGSKSGNILIRVRTAA